MTAGLMQTPPLQIIDILKFAASAHARRAFVSRLVDEPIWRYDYAGAKRVWTSPRRTKLHLWPRVAFCSRIRQTALKSAEVLG